jgi:hypothetical protein
MHFIGVARGTLLDGNCTVVGLLYFGLGEPGRIVTDETNVKGFWRKQ